MTFAWHFKKFAPGDTQKDPIAGAFFQQDALTDTAEALVRESVQNSLDATPRGGKTKVRFRVIRALGREARNRAYEWMKELHPHADAKDSGLSTTTDLKDIEPVIVIEDFGTRGLTGDCQAYQSEEGVRNDFFAFFRAEGFHQKSADSLGKWGVGKTVFPRSSRLNTFFGYSIRDNDSNPVLMGRAIFKTHTAHGTRWHPDGYMGVLRKDELVIPVREPADLRQFRETFDLQRATQPGLSVVVPYSDPDIDETHLLSAAIHDYFVPLLEGRLVVEIIGDDLEDRWVISADSIDGIMAEREDQFTDLDRARVETTRWALRGGREGIEIAPKAGMEGVPAIDDLPFSDPQLERLRSRMNSGEAFAIRQEVVVHPRGQRSVTGTIDVFFQPADPGTKISPVFVRDGIVIWGAGGRMTSGFMVVVLVGGAAGEFVGASENVAHTEWNPSRDGFKETYSRAAGTLRFIKNYPADLLSFLRRSDVDQDPDLLRDFFFLEQEDDPDLPPGDAMPGDTERGKKGPGKSPPAGDGPAARTRYRLTRRDGGFTLSPGAREEGFAGDLRIQVAYMIRRKNPLKAYADTDFQLDSAPLQIVADGAVEIVSARTNELVLRVATGDYSCAVTGFDTERDLFVKVDVLREATTDDDA